MRNSYIRQEYFYGLLLNVIPGKVQEYIDHALKANNGKEIK
jgi:hypothetical protein